MTVDTGIKGREKNRLRIKRIVQEALLANIEVVFIADTPPTKEVILEYLVKTFKNPPLDEADFDFKLIEEINYFVDLPSISAGKSLSGQNSYVAKIYLDID